MRRTRGEKSEQKRARRKESEKRVDSERSGRSGKVPDKGTQERRHRGEDSILVEALGNLEVSEGKGSISTRIRRGWDSLKHLGPGH